ncbi:MAG: hypothetical protein IKK33_11825 [Lachnospiraceae bacterium]|nr:hypothetical protein [Lachnospiraceae bacterium]
MGRINELVCDCLGRPEYYADFWNGTQFKGIPRIQSRYLRRHDTEYHKSQHKPTPKSGIQRDLVMEYQESNAFVLGVEVMENQDYTIPVRVMDYNAQELQRQIKDVRAKNEAEKKDEQMALGTGGEFLYGVKKEDVFLPVHTIVLYCGMQDYDGVESVLGMTNYQTLEPDLQALFTDYPIQVYQLKDLQEEHYQTGLREIIAIFKRSKDRDAVKEYYLEHKERFQSMDELSIDTLGVLIGKSKLKRFKQENGGVDMCKAFEDEREEGREEGIRVGREEGLRQSICNLMTNLKLTSRQAMEALGIPQSEWKKYEQV